jgi:gluconolactonase
MKRDRLGELGGTEMLLRLLKKEIIATAFVIGFGLSTWPTLLSGQEISAGIVHDSSQLELLFDGGVFLEGPAHGPDGYIYFSDITFTDGSNMQAGYIWRYDPSSKSSTVFRSPSGMANGIIFDLDGNMLAAQGADFGGRSVIRTDMSSGKSTIIAGLFNGRSFNAPNDLVIDEAGRIYFTDPRYAGHEPVEQPVMGVYRIDTDGSVSLIIDDAGMPNGIVISPDQHTLYVASVDDPAYALNALLAFDLADDGSVSNRRVLVDFGPELGPDGMAIDVNGSIYLARPSQEPGIYVYSPEGRLEAYIRTDEGPTNVTFGHGPLSQTLFITAQQKLYKIGVTREGYHPAK